MIKLEDSKCCSCYFYTGDMDSILSRFKPGLVTVDFDHNEYEHAYSLRCRKIDARIRHIETEEGYLVPDVSECSDYVSKSGLKGRPCLVSSKEAEWDGFFHRYITIEEKLLALIEDSEGNLIRVDIIENTVRFTDEDIRIEHLMEEPREEN